MIFGKLYFSPIRVIREFILNLMLRVDINGKSTLLFLSVNVLVELNVRSLCQLSTSKITFKKNLQMLLVMGK